MKITQVAGVYFSATGTTEKIVRHVAEKTAQALNVPCSYFNFNLPQQRQQQLSFDQNTLTIVGLPVYAGRVPNVLLPYLKEMLRGSATAAVPIVLFGNRSYDDGLMELNQVLTANGFVPIAAGAFVGEHSFSKTLGAGRPDVSDMRMADKLVDIIISRAALPCPVPVKVAGCNPIRPYYTPRDRHGNPVNILKVKPKTEAALCISCGKCARLCPMGSISPEEVSQITGICIKCCACVKHCPTGAKYYDDERYIYHKTELEEGFSRRAAVEVF